MSLKRVADEALNVGTYVNLEYVPIQRERKKVHTAFRQAVTNTDWNRVTEYFRQLSSVRCLTNGESSTQTTQDIRAIGFQLLQQHDQENPQFSDYLTLLSQQRWVNPYALGNVQFMIRGIEPPVVEQPGFLPTENGFKFFWPGNAVEFSNFKQI